MNDIIEFSEPKTTPPSEAELELAGRIVPPPTHPLAVARDFVAANYSDDHGPSIAAHRGLFYEWVGSHWVEVARDDVKAQLYAWLEHAIYEKETKQGPTFEPFEPNKYKVSNVVEALSAAEYIRSHLEPPTWTRGEPPWGDDNAVSMQNGLLARSSRTLYPHTPEFFNVHVLPFGYEPKAPRPERWLRFLHELWEDDPETISTLQEVMGYVLAGGTEQQKLFGFIGPKRSGKGTILRVLTALLGSENAVGPTLSALATQFGLASLIGKPLAAISDARLGKKADSYIAVERLLAISGEDTITVPRKYKDDWTGRLATRFVLLSNELPAFEDASATIASRFIVLMFRRSFYGRENPRLTEELLEEASGIFNWSLGGLDRLTERGRFIQPESSASAIRHLEDMASPVSAFLRDRGVIDRAATVPKDDVWSAWKEWSEDAGIRKGTKDVLIRDLRAVDPNIISTRPTVDGKRVYMLSGLRLQQVGETIDQTPDTPDRKDSDEGSGPPPSTMSRVEETVSPSPNGYRRPVWDEEQQDFVFEESA
jgi:putative DNA primase/helicase